MWRGRWQWHNVYDNDNEGSQGRGQEKVFVGGGGVGRIKFWETAADAAEYQ